jgi:hypothetical protein
MLFLKNIVILTYIPTKMTTPTPTPTPTPTNSNPYGHVVVKPDMPNTTINSAIPAPVSATNSASVIAASQERNAAHNALVLQQAGRKIGGRSRRKDRKKKSKRSKHHKKSKRSKRHKRGGSIITTTTTTTNTTPSPKPSIAPVPQFSGAHNAGANTNSLAGNHLLMKTGSQAVYDDPTAPGTHTVVN